MAEENFVEEKLGAFLEEVSRANEDENSRNLRPSEIVTMAAQHLGVGSAVVELTYAGLRQSVDREAVSLADARFWIVAAVGVTCVAGAFAKDWLEKFNEQFFVRIGAVRELPSPYELKVPREAAVRFRVMLQAAVAAAESKGKVGKTANGKCLGFRAVKYWGESGGWGSGEGFTEADRSLLKALVERGAVPVNENGAESILPQGDLADARKREEELQGELNGERKRACLAENRLKRAQDELERSRRECDELKEVVERDKFAYSSVENEKKRLQEEIAGLRREMETEREESQQALEETRRRCAVEENRARARADAIADVVSPIHAQIDDARGKPPSGEMCGVLLTHLRRVVEVLKNNGFEV